MNCREAERLLDTFFDGELDGRLMRDAALHITRCQSCERELQEKEGVKTLLADTIEHDVESADLSAIWAGVEAGLQREESVEVGHAAVADAPADEAAPQRRGFERRAGGRHVDPARRTGRRGIGRVSAAGMGAVAVGLAAFLVFNAGPEQNEALLAGQGLDGLGEVDPSAETVVAEKKTEATAPETAVATAPVSAPNTQVALGQAAEPERLASEWTPQQVQVGPLDYSDHAMSLWRPAAVR